MIFDVLFDGSYRFLDRTKAATSDTLLGQITKATFDQVQPRAGSRGEVKMEARTTSEPGVHPRVFVGAVVVDDQVQFRFGWRLGANAL
jgi:hypothetical protein